MEKALRRQFNQQFSNEKYEAYMKQVEDLHAGALDFRNAETPVFVGSDFKRKMLQACEEIIDVITADNFKTLTNRSIPSHLDIPGEDAHPQFIVFDFGICEDGNGGFEPQLIEMQGFPSLFAFQAFHSELTRAYANVQANYDSYLNGYNKDSYVKLFREIVLGNADPAEVILLEIYPENHLLSYPFRHL